MSRLTVYLVYSFTQASPEWWRVLDHRHILVSADDVARRLTEARRVLQGLELLVDSGGFRLISRGRLPEESLVINVQLELSEVAHVKPVVLDSPLPSKTPTDAEVLAANEATLRRALLWQRVFGDDIVVPLHARTEAQIAEAYRMARRVLGSFSTAALGSQALISRFDPCRVAELTLKLRELHDGEVHVFGVGNTTLLLIAALGAADSVDTSAPLIDAKYGLARHPSTLQMAVVAPRRLRGSRPRAKPEEVARLCNCPVCRSNPSILASWGREGVTARAVHNAWLLLRRMLESPLESLARLARRKCIERLVSKAARQGNGTLY